MTEVPEAPEVETLTDDQYAERYLPIPSKDGGDWEYEDTLAFPIEHVWSVVETGDAEHDALYALPGYHVVNMLGYQVTEHPHGFADVEALLHEFEPDPEDE